MLMFCLSLSVLVAPDFSMTLLLAVDARDISGGAVLLQFGVESIHHPACFFSKTFNQSQWWYSP